MRPRFARGCAVLFVWASAINIAGAASADPAPNYPARPIRMIVPFPPGGSNDIMGRYFGNYLTERLNR